ncbi:HNH endonuclease signature motif containing protein [Ligilactobacillus aviarius]|uniref:HNH nuclease domain-containing protein n=1 Tax=Ligilactobacillus aviarius TaxID=1606 RepID=A0A510WRW2_9LACO|nr:HNH endonuclease signature motif containing protein [Ligilactobacillus aviarius]KRM38331.1 hypothetical protein FC33_GL000411 [Ligilactobacillus aviarius subsp. aviarius DSM 20655]GEK41327.1 hypothetical protein LAV01_01590 [Ligilactobacillus aviarius]
MENVKELKKANATDLYVMIMNFWDRNKIVKDKQGNLFTVLKDNQYLTQEEAKSHQEYFKQIGKYTLLSSKGYTYNLTTGKTTKGHMNAWGYMTINYQGTTTTINNLLYRLFVGSIPEDFVIHHINHNKEDNRLSNLACISRADNLRERFINNPSLGKQMFSNKNSNYIYCESNNTLYKNKTTLAKDLNLLISACNKVIEGTWKHYKGYKFRFLTDEEQEKATSFNFFEKGTKMVNI